MRVTFIAMNQGHSGAYRAGRFFPNDVDVVMDVLDQEDDPPKVKNDKGVEVPDPKQIGFKSFELLRADPRIKVLADQDTQALLSQGAFDEARRQAATIAGELAALKIDHARLGEENKALRAQVTELQKAAPSPATEGDEKVPAPSGKKSK